MSISQGARRIGGEAAYTILARANELERKGKSIIHFEIGQPDFDTPPVVVNSAIWALKAGKTRYTPSLGMPELREAIAKSVTATRGVVTSMDSVAVTPSAKTALLLAMAAVVDVGDEVIYPDPGFPAYENLAIFLGAIPKPMPLLERNNFSLDVPALARMITLKTKLIILNSPSNPTGSIIPHTDLLALARLVKEHKNLFILTDEIYSDILYGKRYPSFYAVRSMRERTFLVSGFSKMFSMTGWRLGYIIAPKQFMDPLDRLAVNFFASTAHFTQYAGITALTKTARDVRRMVVAFERRRDILVKGLNAIPGITCHTPEGAFYVFPNITKTGMSSQMLAEELLEKAGVALLAGTAFGPHGEGYLRLSYANSLKNIRLGISRIKKYLGHRI